MTNEEIVIIENEEIDLLATWKIIWRGKIMLISVTAIFAITSVLYALYLPNIYRADATLFPISEYSQNSDNNLGGGLREMAGLAGVNLGSSESSKTVLALEILESRSFIIEFINNHNIKPILLALKKWDKNSGIETIDDQLYDVEQNKWLIDKETKESLEPSDLIAYNIFKNNLIITSDLDTKVVKVSLDFLSPVRAKEWLDFIIEDLNEIVRNKDIMLADKSIKFLEEKLELTQVSGIQRIFFNLIEDQLRKRLMAETMEEYVFTTIDPAVVAETHVNPKRALICILGTFIGGIIGLAVVFVRHIRKG